METLADMEASSPAPEKLKFTDVPRGPEFVRIRSLARRPVPNLESPEAVELAEFLTERLAKVPDPYPGRLRPIQAVALQEAWENGGLAGMLRAGSGKTLISYLAPAVLGISRALYVCPAGMIPDVQVEFSKMSKSWNGPALHEIPIVSYEMFASPENGEVLDDNGKVVRQSLLARMAPKLVILDECHRCSAGGATTTKRFDAYFRDNPDVAVIAVSGTFFKTTIKDGAHLLEWALGDRAPLPCDFQERELWASFTDVRKAALRAGVGGLVDFLSSEERRAFNKESFDDARRRIVRRAIARHMFETPGVLGTTEAPVPIPLTISSASPLRRDPKLEEVFVDFRKYERLPDGRELEDPLAIARSADQLGLGFYSIWLPPPGVEFQTAWSEWAKWCRKAIKHNKRRIDSEARMKDAVRKGLYNDEGALERWESELAAFRQRSGLLEPPSVPVWVSDEAIDSAAEWVERVRGLVWVKYIGLGQRIAERCRMPYYGEEGIDQKTGRHIKQHRGGPAVASIAANGTGRNLQGFWSQNLWLCMPTEQSLARTHRPGQKASVVTNEIYIGCAEHLKSYYYAADHKAAFAADMNGDAQRLHTAITDMPSMAYLSLKYKTPRWRLPTKEDTNE